MKKWLSYVLCQVRSDLMLRFSGSYLGIFWSIINPLLQISTYFFLFAFVFKVRFDEGGKHFSYFLFVLSGIGCWLSFQEGLISSANCIVRNASIVKNVIFPLEVLPISSILCSLIVFFSCYTTLMLALLITGKGIGIAIISLPFVFVVQLTAMLGLSYIMALIGVFLPDIFQILPIFLQFLMLVTPIMYPKNTLPSHLQFLVDINPLYYLVSAYQNIFYFQTWPNFYVLLFLLGFSAIIIFFGKMLFASYKGLFEAVI